LVPQSPGRLNDRKVAKTVSPAAGHERPDPLHCCRSSAKLNGSKASGARVQVRKQKTFDWPSAPVASAAIAMSLKRFRGPPAQGYVSSTLRAVAGVEILLAPLRPVSGRDREFRVCPRLTGPAALLSSMAPGRMTATGR